MDKQDLPTVARKKKINLKKLIELAKKVRESLKEEERYLREQKPNENNTPSGLFAID